MKQSARSGRAGYLTRLVGNVPVIIRTRRTYGFNSVVERLWFDLGHGSRVCIPRPGKRPAPAMQGEDLN